MIRQRSSQLQKYKAVRNASSNSIHSEGMQGGWRKLRVDSLKLVDYTRIENTQSTQENFCFLCGCYMYYY